MLRKYTFGFDVWALILFLAVMLPTFVWSAVPAPNDILRNESVTPLIDAAASVCQVAAVAALCMLKNTDSSRKISLGIVIAVIICCVLYYAGWAIYYTGATNAAVIACLTVPPCLALLLYAVGRKNLIAAVPAAVFMVCHVIFALVNFVI